MLTAAARLLVPIKEIAVHQVRQTAREPKMAPCVNNDEPNVGGWLVCGQTIFYMFLMDRLVRIPFQSGIPRILNCQIIMTG